MGSIHIVRPLLIAAMAGCSSAATDQAPRETAAPTAASTTSANTNSDGAASPAKLREIELGATEPVHAVGNIYLAGQPPEDEIDDLAERGLKTVITLRKPEELDWDEAAAVEAAGMEFVAVPFDGPEELTDEVFQRVQKLLAEKRDAPVILHCGRCNRVGAVWMVHRVLNDGVGIDQALEEAKTAGLRTPEYIAKAQDYIRRAQTAAPSGEAVEVDSTP